MPRLLRSTPNPTAHVWITLPFPNPADEWALAQAANGFIDYDGTTDYFSISPEQAMVFVEKDSPVYLEGAFDIVAAMIEGEPKSRPDVRAEQHPSCSVAGGGNFRNVRSLSREPGVATFILGSS